MAASGQAPKSFSASPSQNSAVTFSGNSAYKDVAGYTYDLKFSLSMGQAEKYVENQAPGKAAVVIPVERADVEVANTTPGRTATLDHLGQLYMAGVFRVSRPYCDDSTYLNLNGFRAGGSLGDNYCIANLVVFNGDFPTVPTPLPANQPMQLPFRSVTPSGDRFPTENDTVLINNEPEGVADAALADYAKGPDAYVLLKDEFSLGAITDTIPICSLRSTQRVGILVSSVPLNC